MKDPLSTDLRLVEIDQQPDGKIITRISADAGEHSFRGFGLIIYDLVRHVSAAFHVHEDEVWEWVVKERHHHTTDITRPS